MRTGMSEDSGWNSMTLKLLQNDGRGMEPREQMRVLKPCLKQSYASIYRVEVEKAQDSGEFQTNPNWC